MLWWLRCVSRDLKKWGLRAGSPGDTKDKERGVTCDRASLFRNSACRMMSL